MNNSLKFNLKLITENSDLVIENLDMDFHVFKNNKAENNKACIHIWNLNETLFQQLTERDRIIDFYAGYGEKADNLVFRGYIDREKLKKGRPKNYVDNLTVLYLIDGLKAYTAVMNKNYRSKVSSTQIIQDCISAMGFGDNNFLENLPVIYFRKFKAVGYAHVILQRICEPLGIKFNVQNNIISITNTEVQNSDLWYLYAGNCYGLNKKGDDEILIRTMFTPVYNPDNWVQCEFDEYTGNAQIKEITHYGNNYGTACTTEIVIGV